MKQFSKTPLLFIFFCLTSCEWPGEYRDIEISIEGVDYAMVYIFSLPDSNQTITKPFDRRHAERVHLSHIPDGHIMLRVSADKNRQMVNVDTAITYTGRFGWGVEF
ncbi:hypothetical protein [Dyadobacter sp. 32]|uniref:hypothetical protein n=1 Tax=Dyadobacter sp. 32 TaxID=538966 RepID=UPI0011EF6B0E